MGRGGGAGKCRGVDGGETKRRERKERKKEGEGVVKENRK